MVLASNRAEPVRVSDDWKGDLCRRIRLASKSERGAAARAFDSWLKKGLASLQNGTLTVHWDVAQPAVATANHSRSLDQPLEELGPTTRTQLHEIIQKPSDRVEESRVEESRSDTQRERATCAKSIGVRWWSDHFNAGFGAPALFEREYEIIGLASAADRAKALEHIRSDHYLGLNHRLLRNPHFVAKHWAEFVAGERNKPLVKPLARAEAPAAPRYREFGVAQ